MIPAMPFGRTGHASTRVIFGAAALGAMSQQRADATLELIAGHGVNHIDTAASYGESELHLAPWLADHRDSVFLATKTGERSGGTARAELERSLARLATDRVDLVQLHNLVEEEEWRTAFAPGGVVEAMATARDEGLEDDPGRRLAWYEPLRDPAAIERAVRFVLAEPDLFLNTTSDATVLPLVLEAAARLDRPFEAPTSAEVDADIDGLGMEPIFDGGTLERI